MTQPPHPPEERHTSGSPWLGLLTGLIGFVVFVVGNTMLFSALATPSQNSVLPELRGANAVGVAALLLLVALAGVALAVRGTHYFVKGLGIGLMLGWALMSIASAGVCTGLNPSLYSATPL